MHALAEGKLWYITFSIIIATYVWDEFTRQREVREFTSMMLVTVSLI